MEEKKGCYGKYKMAILERYSYTVRPFKHHVLPILAVLRSGMNLVLLALIVIVAVKTSKAFLPSIFPGKRPNATGI